MVVPTRLAMAALAGRADVVAVVVMVPLGPRTARQIKLTLAIMFILTPQTCMDETVITQFDAPTFRAW
ncbi:hypothetical protein GCM10023321_51350 [Pseudonocardia eucalypti]|uniref:Secreted protein n=1 Tax=Pseudonocardia eucalypti TaxID=648755 RepID=A0ABP9QLT8_9PSEU